MTQVQLPPSDPGTKRVETGAERRLPVYGQRKLGLSDETPHFPPECVESWDTLLFRTAISPSFELTVGPECKAVG